MTLLKSLLDPIVNKSVQMSFGAGSTILYQGEVPRSACVLVSGAVRVYAISSTGDEQIISFHVGGEFFPTPWIFKKAPSTVFFYETIAESTVAFVSRDQLISFLYGNQERINALVDYLTTNFAASEIRVNALEQPKARDKLLYTMYYLSQRYGRQLGSKIYIPITLTHQNLAGMVGLTRETTAVELYKLKKLGVLDYKKQRYEVSHNKLLDYIDEDSFRSLSIKSLT